MKGLLISLIGVLAALFGWLIFPGMPGCATTREDYCILVAQSVTPSILLTSVGLAFLILGAYKMSQERIKPTTSHVAVRPVLPFGVIHT